MTDKIKPDTMGGATLDIAADNRSKLKSMFPTIFTETRNEAGELIESVDLEKLKAELGTFTDTFEQRRERYGMDWPGKKDCLKLIQTPSYATLKPCRDESVNFDTTENLFIEGDNFEVLKLLQKSYYGKIKMIYIDPPYNTGKEFIYPDNYSESLDTYLTYAGLVDDDGRKFSTNTANEGRFHTKWLNMMYPRLYLARNLLQDDGVIFISIDDNELNNLQKICDDVFGADNFVSVIIIQSNKRGQTYKDIAKTHEYLLVYSKTNDSAIGELEKADDVLPYEDAKGKFDLWELRNRNPKFGRHNRHNLYYPIYVAPSEKDASGFSKISLTQDEKFNLEVTPKNSEGVDGCWRWGHIKVSSSDLTSENPVVVARQKRDGDWNIYEKSRKSTTRAKSLWDETAVISEQGTMQLGELNLAGCFDHPKPVGLIQKALQIGATENDIILDFFAGSASTAQALMQQNAEDSGNRKYILVQLPEPCLADSEAFKSGYKTIADIAKERIRRAIKQITDKNDGELDFNDASSQDLGFKVLKLDKSNFKQWQRLAADSKPEQIAAQLEMHIDHIDPKATPEDLLFEILIKDGFSPTEKVEAIILAGIEVFSVADGALLLCLADTVSKELIDAVAEKEPFRFICLDSAFHGNDQLKANAVQTFTARNQGRDKSSQIVFRTV